MREIEATTGPWKVERHYDGFRGVYAADEKVICLFDDPWYEPDASANPWQNAEFIAQARDDVPWLLAELVAVRAERDALLQQIEDWENWSNDLTEFIPAYYDGDETQEAIILRWAADVGAERDALQDAMYQAWTVIANARDWLLDDDQAKQWVLAAQRWRDEQLHPVLDRAGRLLQPGPESGQP